MKALLTVCFRFKQILIILIFANTYNCLAIHNSEKKFSTNENFQFKLSAEERHSLKDEIEGEIEGDLIKYDGAIVGTLSLLWALMYFQKANKFKILANEMHIALQEEKGKNLDLLENYKDRVEQKMTSLLSEYKNKFEELESRYRHQSNIMAKNIEDVNKEIISDQTKFSNMIEIGLANVNGNEFVSAKLGIDNFKTGNFKAAIQYFEKILISPPALMESNVLAGLYYMYASSLNSVGQISEAIKNYEKTLNIKSDNASAWFDLGQIYFSINQKAKARESFINSVNLKADPKLYNDIGNLFGEDNDQHTAIQYYYLSLRCDRTFIPAYSNLIETFVYLGDFDQANENLLKLKSFTSNESFYTCFFTIVLTSLCNENFDKNILKNLNKIKVSVDYDCTKINFSFEELFFWLTINKDVDKTGKKFLMELINAITDWINNGDNTPELPLYLS